MRDFFLYFFILVKKILPPPLVYPVGKAYKSNSWTPELWTMAARFEKTHSTDRPTDHPRFRPTHSRSLGFGNKGNQSIGNIYETKEPSSLADTLDPVRSLRN